MKTFIDEFFNKENFLVTQYDYNYLENSQPSYHICYNVNNQYIHIMGVSIVSVLENNKEMHFTFHIFTDGCDEENRNKVKILAQKWKCRCIIYILNMKPFQDFHIKVSRFSRITYARLYMPKVLKKKVKRYIYLDADTMCIKSIRALSSLNMNGAPMGAVSERASAIKYRADFLKLKSEKYFNDGVMLIDVNSWENASITEKAFSYQKEPRERFLGQSQDVLNLVFDGKNYQLPACYNVYDGGAYDEGNGVIIHWTGRRKPWQMVLTDFDAQWRTYNALSPWKTITNILPVKKPENYHDFQQWGRYQKARGNISGYIKGMFWYSWLRIRYKIGIQ